MATSPDLVVRVSANITALQQGMKDASGEVNKLSEAATQATNPFTNLHAAAEKFDGVLAVAGIHIRTELHGLADLGDAAGKTTEQMGALGAAGLAVGAGLGGWKIGRMVADFFDLDEKIGNATAKLLGFGDVAAQTAGAKADAMALATQRAGHEVTIYTEAIRINADWVKKHTEEIEKAIKAGKEWADAMVELNAAGKGWQGTLMTIDGETVSAIKYYLEAGVSQNVLAKAYALTDVQVKAVASSLEAEKEQIKQLTEYQAVWSKFHTDTLVLAAEHERQWAEESKRILASRNQAVVDGFTAIKQATQSLQDFEDQSWMEATDFQVKKIWQVANEQIAAFKGTEEQRAQFNSAILTLASAQADALYAKDVEYADKTVEKLQEVIAVAKQATGEQNIASGNYYAVPSSESLTKAGIIQSTISQAGYSIPLPKTRDSGGPVKAGESYYIGTGAQPEMFSPKSDGWMTPAGAAGPSVTNYISVTAYGTNGTELAHVIDTALMERARNTGQRFPA